MTKNIIITGTGGQGTLLSGKIIGTWAMQKGFDVLVQEVHGMSQRGGSVVTHVRINPNTVWSPVVDIGCGDIILAFEALEGLRAVNYLKKDGEMILNTQEIPPMPVITGAFSYPANITDILTGLGISLTPVDAYALAIKAGGEMAVNVVMIGALAAKIDKDKATWEQAIKACVKAKFLDLNLMAFALGYG